MCALKNNPLFILQFCIALVLGSWAYHALLNSNELGAALWIWLSGLVWRDMWIHGCPKGELK